MTAHKTINQRGEDRLSALPDDVLLCILGGVDLSTATRTSALSTRWRLLPWLLPDLDIDVDDFISDPHSKPIEANVIHNAMLTVTEATKSFFAKPRRESIVARLQLRLYSIVDFSCDIGPPVCGAIERGLLEDLDLAILDEMSPWECTEPHVLKRAQDIDGFFCAYPSVFLCLTGLHLRNVRFLKLDMNHLLFECCTQLKHLSLSNCDAGLRSRWKVDSPNSKLSVMELDMCFFERIELVCLPKLEKLHWDDWISEDWPLTFGCVPSLGELHLADDSDLNPHVFKLSELLNGTTGIHTLSLDFKGDNIWMQPEMKKLTSALSKIRKLYILGIFVEFDLVWTMTLLESAPSVEILQIQAWEHVCDINGHSELQNLSEKTSPRWEMDFHGSKNPLLQELHVSMFSPKSRMSRKRWPGELPMAWFSRAK